MIDVLHLSRRYGGTLAVDDLTMSVQGGEIFGLLGPNGAGKTTTLRVLATLIAPSSGNATIEGLSVTDKSALTDIRKIIGLLPEVPGLYESLSAFRNLDFYAEMYDVPKGARDNKIEELLKALEIWDDRSKPVATFSKGMKQKIAIARALVHDPKVLFLDEPMSGLDPSARKTVKDFIRSLKNRGRTIFLNTHNLDDAQQLCDRVAVLNTKLIALDSPENLGKGLWKPKLAITIAKKEDAKKALEILHSFGDVSQAGERFEVGISEHRKDDPKIIQKLVTSGVEIMFAEEVRHTLEESYLELLGRQEALK